MLYGGADALALHSLDIPDHNLRSEIRILAQVFEVSAVHRSAINIDARSEHKVTPFRARASSNFLSHAAGQCGIPRRRQTNPACHGSCGSVVANTERSIRHLEWRQPQPGERTDEHVVNSAKHVNLLFERHPTKNGVHALLDIVRCRRSSRSRRIRSPHKDKRERNTEFAQRIESVHWHSSHGLSSPVQNFLTTSPAAMAVSHLTPFAYFCESCV